MAAKSKKSPSNPAPEAVAREWDGQTTSIPAGALWFRDQGGAVEFAKRDDDEFPCFTMDAYTGAPMGHPFFGQVVIDVAGVALGKGKVGVLREHARDRIVGYGRATKRSGHVYVKDGVFSSVTADGQEVAGTLAEGYPWQCSINIDDAEVVDLAQGEKMKVNGATVKGPAVVFTKSRLREVSFCSLGMDAGTSASIAAADGEVAEIKVLKNTPEEEEMSKEQTPDPTPEVDVDKIKADAKAEGTVEAVARFDALCKEFDQDFAVEAFRAGWDLDAARLQHYSRVKEELAALKAAKPEAPPAPPVDEGRPEPVPTGAAPQEPEAPKDLKAAALQLQKERNANGENLTLGNAMKILLVQRGHKSDKEIGREVK